MQSRRGFLGSVLGLIGTTPFHVKAVPTKRTPERIAAIQRKVGIFFEDPRVLQRYAIYAKVAGTESRVFMPEILEVEVDPEAMRATFRSHELDIRTSAQFDAAGLLDAESELIAERPFAADVYVGIGDRFTATITIQLDEGSSPTITDRIKYT